MSTYNNGRRAPNVSQYIANLNTIPTPQELAAQSEIDITNDGLDFLNTDFFDFDASTFDPNGEFSGAAAGNGDNFQYPDFSNYAQTPFSQLPTIIPSPSAAPFAQDLAGAVVGDKRSASTAGLQPLGDLEDPSSHAAEEDKRRRNTAASARFRVKKKQREAALEKQTKEMSDQVERLENRVQQLEMENKWLKGLITEKSDMNTEEKFQKFVKEKQVESKPDERNDGVGTKTVVKA